MNRSGLEPGATSSPSARARYVIPFEEAGEEPLSRIGGKCIGLAALVRANAQVSPGFVVTTDAYAAMMGIDGLGEEIGSILEQLDATDIRSTRQISRDIAEAIARRPAPPGLEAAVREAYGRLPSEPHVEASVAVRSSGTGEDLPDASFAGQGDTYLSITGADAVLSKVKLCWASLYTERAISYRAQCGVGHLDVQMAVAVQVMVQARSAGVAMTLDPANGDRSKIAVESTWGLGETLVSGEVTPDHFLVDKVMLMPVTRRIGFKDHELITDPTTRCAVHREVDSARRDAPSISDEELKAIALAAKQIEQHFGCPQDIEWAIDEARKTGNGVVILQSRPETVWSKKPAHSTNPGSSATGAQGVLDSLISRMLKSTQ